MDPAPLHAIESLAFLSAQDREELARSMVEIQVAPGQEILREGHPSSAGYLLLAGQLRVRKRLRRTPDSFDLPGILPVGEWFGLVSLLDHGPVTASVHAVGEVTLAALGREEFEQLLEDGHPVGARLLRTWLGCISEQLRRVNDATVLLKQFLEDRGL